MDYPSDMDMVIESSLDPALDFDANLNGLMLQPRDDVLNPDFNFFIHEPTNEEQTHGNDEEIPTSSNQYENIYVDRMVVEEECGNFEEQCSQPILDLLSGKCKCRLCINKAFDREIKDLFQLDIPNQSHFLAFHYPEDLDGSSFSDINVCPTEVTEFGTLTVLPKATPGLQGEDNSKKKSRKKRAKSSKIPDSTAVEALALIQDALRSNGTLPGDLLLRMQRLSDNAQHVRISENDQIDCKAHNEGGRQPIKGTKLTNLPVLFREDSPSRSCSSETIRGNHSDTMLPFISPNCSTGRSLTGSRIITPNLDILYQCTFKECTRSHTSRYEWERHEKSVHKERYMCMKCASPQRHPLGDYACGFCMDLNSQPFPNLEAAKRHTLECSSAREAVSSYHRKETLRTHLRKKHGIRNPHNDSFEWVYDIDNEWLKECGFCGTIFRDWDSRACHIEVHFKAGADIATWTVPFFKVIESTSSVSEDSDGYEDSDDEGDEDTKGQGDEEEEEDDDRDGDEDDDDDSDEDNNDDDRDCIFGDHDRNKYYSYHFRKQGVNIRVSESKVDPRRPTRNDGHNHVGISPLLEIWLATEEQSELLLLGLGRKPLNVVIGSPKVSECKSLPLQKTTPREGDSASRGAPRQDQLGIIIPQPSTKVILPTDLESLAERQSVPITQDNSLAMIVIAKGNPGVSKRANCSPECNILDVWLDVETSSLWESKAVLQQKFTRQLSVDTKSSSTSQSRTISARSLYSTQPSTAPTENLIAAQLLIHPLVLANLISTTSPTKLLRCDFEFTGCTVLFLPNDYAEWLHHTVSHFCRRLPPKAICVFCDHDDAIFEARGGDRSLNWASRMQHIAEHVEEGVDPEADLRPDFFVIDHMWAEGDISEEDYKLAISCSERPKCSDLGLVPAGFKVMSPRRRAKERNYFVHDQAREDRIRRRDGEGNKSTGSNLGSELFASRKTRFNVQISYNTEFKEIRHEPEKADRKTKITENNHDKQIEGSATSRYSPDSTVEHALPTGSGYKAMTRRNEMIRSNSRHSDFGSYSTREGPEVLQRPSTPSQLVSKARNHSISSRRCPKIKNHEISNFSDSYSLYSLRAGVSTSERGNTPPLDGSDLGKTERQRRHRIPDDDNELKYITSTKSCSGKNLVIAHQAARFDRNEPQASEARYEDYQRTNRRRV